MQTLHYRNFGDLTADLAFDLIERIKATDWGGLDLEADFGSSNVSCSAYCELHWTEIDEDGDEEGECFKIRFSDHPDRNGADYSIDITSVIETVENAGVYVETLISSEDYDRLLALAWKAVNDRVKEIACPA